MGDPNIIIGDILLPELCDKVCITVIATGCGNTGAQQAASVQIAPAQPYVAPTSTPRASDLVNTIGGPTAGYQQPAPQAAPAAPQPVAATPRPTALNFVALAQTVPMPTVSAEAPAAQQSVFTQHGAAPAGFAAPSFSATAPAEETILGTPNASLPETQEFSAAADVDIMNTVSEKNGLGMREEPSLETPTFIRNTMAEKSVPASVGVTREACALRSSGVDYDVPAFLRGSDVF
jgi:cell division protein FtsZ